MKFGSLFSGIGGFEIGLKTVFPNAECEFFSEIDKFSIQTFLKNFPENQDKNLGDIERVVFDKNNKNQLSANDFRLSLLPDIDLLFAGSPCQDLTIAQKNRKELDGERSRLFFAFLEIIRVKKPKYFLLENVGSMSQKSRNAISELLGVQPVRINSRDYCGQKRDRLYWFNWPFIPLKRTAGIDFEQVIDSNVSEEDAPTIDIDKPNYSSIKDYTGPNRGFAWSKSTRYPKDADKFTENRATFNRANCLTTGVGCSNQSSCNVVKDQDRYRYLSPNEAETLQSFPKDWTKGVSRSQRYRQVGNSVSPNLLIHIFLCLKKNQQGTNNNE